MLTPAELSGNSSESKMTDYIISTEGIGAPPVGGRRMSTTPSRKSHVSKYRILREQGSIAGGSSRVFTAAKKSSRFDNRPSQVTLVAVKVLQVKEQAKARALDKRMGFYNMPLTTVDSVQNEVDLLNRLQPHENIVKFFESFYEASSQQRIWIIMEKCKIDLQSIVSRVGAKGFWGTMGTCLLATEVVAIAKGILEGIKHIHANNIIHLDLKCGNILITDEGQIKLCDFGSAKWHPSNDKLLLKDIKGSSEYMAPELFIKDHVCDNTVDLWAFGIILRILTYGETSYSENAQKVKRFRKQEWDAYRSGNEEYFYEIIGDHSVDYVKHPNKFDEYEVAPIHRQNVLDKCEQLKEIVDAMKRCLVPRPKNGPNGDITREDTLDRAELPELLDSNLFKTADEYGPEKRNSIIRELVQRVKRYQKL